MNRPNRKTWARGAALLAVVLTSTASLGQAPPSAGGGAASTPSAVAAQVNAHFDAGLAALDRKDWKKAADEFGKAYALKPLPQIAGNLAEAELKLGRYRDAAEHAEKFLREFKGASTQDKKDGNAWLNEARKKIVTLKITVEGTGVEVLIDGKVVGISPLPPEVYVDPGKHTVEARSGSARDEATDTYEAGWVRLMNLAPKEPAVGPVATGTPTAAPTATSLSGGGDQTGPNKKLVIGGAALGGAMVVAGGIFVGLAASKASDAGGFGAWDACYRSPPPKLNCPMLHAAHKEVALFGNLSTGMFLGGLVVGGATLLYALGILPPGSSPRKSAVLAVPVIGSSGGGLSVTGQF